MFRLPRSWKRLAGFFAPLPSSSPSSCAPQIWNIHHERCQNRQRTEGVTVVRLHVSRPFSEERLPSLLRTCPLSGRSAPAESGLSLMQECRVEFLIFRLAAYALNGNLVRSPLKRQRSAEVLLRRPPAGAARTPALISTWNWSRLPVDNTCAYCRCIQTDAYI